MTHASSPGQAITYQIGNRARSEFDMKVLITAIVFLIFPAPVNEGGRVDTAQAQRFTGNNMFPRWSHDGKKIVFTSDRDGDPEIYSMDADGSNPLRLTYAPGRGEDFRTGRTLSAKGALMAEEIDVLIRQKTGGKKRLRDSFHAMMVWAEKSGRAFRVDELPGLIVKPIGVDEKEIKAIIERWLR